MVAWLNYKGTLIRYACLQHHMCTLCHTSTALCLYSFMHSKHSMPQACCLSWANASMGRSCIPAVNEPIMPSCQVFDALPTFQACDTCEMPHILVKVTCVRCSPDGQLIASASLDLTVCIWTLQTSVSTAWQKLAVLRGHTGRVTCLCFTPDSRHLVTGRLQNNTL